MSQQLVPTKQPQDLRFIVQSETVLAQLKSALPKYYSADQFAVVVRTQINRNPKLGECDATSLIACMLQAAQMGIVPNGRDGHLIPRWNKKANEGRGAMECTFIADYKGMVGLVRKHETVSDIYAEPVHEHDLFRITKGLHRDIVHEVDIRQDRGEFIGVYAVIANKDGSASWDFMSKSEIEAIRARSQSPNFGPWATDYIEMAKKTVLRRLLKLADISQEVSDRLAADPELTNSPTNIEIKPAAVPHQAALPAAPEVPQDEPEPTASNIIDLPPAEEPKQKLQKAPKKKDEPKAQEKTHDERSSIEIMREKLSESEKTEDQLIAILTEYELAKDGQKLSDLPENAIVVALKHWQEIAEELSK